MAFYDPGQKKSGKSQSILRKLLEQGKIQPPDVLGGNAEPDDYGMLPPVGGGQPPFVGPPSYLSNLTPGTLNPNSVRNFVGPPKYLSNLTPGTLNPNSMRNFMGPPQHLANASPPPVGPPSSLALPHQTNTRTFVGPPANLSNAANPWRAPVGPFLSERNPPLVGPPASAQQNRAGASPALQAMLAQGPVSNEMFTAMQAARERGLLRERTQEPGPMQVPSMTSPLAARPTVPPQASRAFNPSQAPGGLDPDARAMIDAMTGKRVHKGLGGQQLGMEGVNPTLKYLLYSQRGRRHRGMGGQDVY